jgi:hypothetical protein
MARSVPRCCFLTGGKGKKPNGGSRCRTTTIASRTKVVDRASAFARDSQRDTQQFSELMSVPLCPLVRRARGLSREMRHLLRWDGRRASRYGANDRTGGALANILSEPVSSPGRGSRFPGCRPTSPGPSRRWSPSSVCMRHGDLRGVELCVGYGRLP